METQLLSPHGHSSLMGLSSPTHGPHPQSQGCSTFLSQQGAEEAAIDMTGLDRDQPVLMVSLDASKRILYASQEWLDLFR